MESHTQIQAKSIVNSLGESVGVQSYVGHHVTDPGEGRNDYK